MDREISQNEIAIVTQYFYPDTAATGVLLTTLAKGLVSKGLDVKVYTGYPSYWGKSQSCKKYENLDGVQIERIFHLISDTRTKFGAILHGVSFFFFVFLKLILVKDRRLYLIVTTPPFLPYVGYFLHILRGFDYIIIIHDIDPDISIQLKFIRKGVLTRFWDATFKTVYKNSKKIIVLGECMAEVMREKNHEDTEKITVIQNWEDENFIKPLDKNQNIFAREHNLIDKFVILYSGNMGLNHNLLVFLDAASQITDKNILFLFIGEGAQKKALIKKSFELNLKNVKFLDFQPREILPLVMTCSDVIIVSQEQGTDGLCVSSKFYPALASGRPILALVGEKTEVARVIHQFQCGIVINDYDPSSISREILRLYNDTSMREYFGKNGREIFEKKFTSTTAITRYIKLINEIIKT